MVIHNINQYNVIYLDLQSDLVIDCRDAWASKYHYELSSLFDIMNKETYRFNYEHDCSVALTYHFNLNKW